LRKFLPPVRLSAQTTAGCAVTNVHLPFPQQVANINKKDIVYIGHHLSSTYAPLARNNFMGCSERWGEL